MARPAHERLWKRVLKTDSCWLWTGAKDTCGYGVIRAHGKRTNTHRLAYELTKGPIPTGQELDHFVCQTPACVNPDHLEPVSHLENMRRGRLTDYYEQQRTKEYCVNGHVYTLDNTYIGPKRGERQCRTCRNIAAYKYRQRKSNKIGALHCQ